MGVERAGTDTRIEGTDRPTSSERPYPPPPDNPGSPGQPSRLQDRARAREESQEDADRDDQTTGNGTEQTAERDDKPATSQNESNGEASSESEISDQEKKVGEPPSQDVDSQDGGTLGGETPGERDQPSPDARKPETGRFQDRESEPLPRRDDPAPGTSDDDRQRALGGELADLSEKKIDAEIDQTLDKVNPKFDCNKSAYSENCTSVVQANELRRRGTEVEAGPLEKHLRMDEGGPGGRPLGVIEQAWGGKFVPGDKAEIESTISRRRSTKRSSVSWSPEAVGSRLGGNGMAVTYEQAR